MSSSKLETMIAQLSPAQRKHFAALVAAMQATPAPVAAPKVRKPKLAADHPVVIMAKAKLATPRVYPFANAAGAAVRSATLLEVEGAVKVVLTSMGTLYWYDAKGVELANQVLPAADAAALRAQYAHALTLPVWA
jgi:hypothetical protein